MATVTVNKTKVNKDRGVVVLPIKDYLKLLKDAVPTTELSFVAARELDRLAEEGIKEHKVGKTELTQSFLKREYSRLYRKHYGK